METKLSQPGFGNTFLPQMIHNDLGIHIDTASFAYGAIESLSDGQAEGRGDEEGVNTHIREPDNDADRIIGMEGGKD